MVFIHLTFTLTKDNNYDTKEARARGTFFHAWEHD